MQYERLKVTIAAFLLIQMIGVIGYMLIEDLSFIDALYLTVVTVATVGYGDIIPKTPVGRLFTMGLIISGVGMAYYTFMLIISALIEGQLKNVWGRRSMNRRIAAMNNHIIVCGAGRVGANTIERLLHEKENYVVIDRDQQIVDSLMEQQIPAVHGDATFDEILLAAGVARAKGIITALSHDADNVYVTLTAKSMNPDITIVARAERPEAAEKLKRAGANTIIFPSVMGGRQLAASMTKPVVTDLVENVFFNQEIHVDIAQITVRHASPLVGKTLVQSAIKEQYDSIIVAIKRGETLLNNPRAQEVIQSGDIMILLGQRDHLFELNRVASLEFGLERDF